MWTGEAGGHASSGNAACVRCSKAIAFENTDRRYLTFYSYTLQLLQLLASFCSYLPKVGGWVSGAYLRVQGRPYSFDLLPLVGRDWGWHPLRVWQMTWRVRRLGLPMWYAAPPPWETTGLDMQVLGQSALTLVSCR